MCVPEFNSMYFYLQRDDLLNASFALLTCSDISKADLFLNIFWRFTKTFYSRISILPFQSTVLDNSTQQRTSLTQSNEILTNRHVFSFIDPYKLFIFTPRFIDAFDFDSKKSVVTSKNIAYNQGILYTECLLTFSMNHY